MLSQEEIQNALKAVKYPGYSRDIVSFGLVKEISAANGAVSVDDAIDLAESRSRAANQNRKRTRSESFARREPRSRRSAPAGRRPGRAGKSVCKSKRCSRRETRHRRRQRQGRRRQIHLLRESRLRAHASRRESRFAGLRHLRAEHSADDGRSRKTDRQRSRAPRAAVQSRRESDEHRAVASRTTSR